MSQQLTLELSDEVYAALQRQANAVGLSVAEWVIATLSQKNHTSSNRLNFQVQKDAARLRFRSHAGAVSLGYATDAGNESIDADLARAYADEY
ncbi:hypothetical protein [Synechococcus sp. PCC 7336]|uniref:hypothetical protein n=1 Tax=Synechococcus sp. PCC 7336 TaxID=195250 RepID=UPI00034AC9C0|nr:hypothetical protein [Synechococcus sp. PCC 7336]